MRARLWTYPWDVRDDGPEVALSRIAGAGFQELSLAAAYHGAMLFLPHNPRRRVYCLEDGVVYFRPDERFYRDTPIKPVPSNLTGPADPLAQIAGAAKGHGLDTVAWTVTLHNSRLGMRFPEYTVENAYGDRYPYALCPAQPAVRAFTRGLVADLSSRYPLSAVEVEALYYGAYPHAWTHAKEGIRRSAAHEALLSLCFCPACQAAAAPLVDAAALRERVRAYLDAEFVREVGDQAGAPDPASPGDLDRLVPGYAAYAAARTQVVSTLVQEVRSACQVPLSAIVGSGVPRRAWAFGVDPAAFASTCDSLTYTCYQPEADAVQREASFARSLAGNKSLFVGLQALWPLARSAEDLAAKVAAARRAGAEGVSVYNYGLMPLPHLDWCRQALEVTL
jgi:hypothetical protein